MFRSWLVEICLISAVVGLSSLAMAQTSTARISGTVTDESGGVLPAVQVAVRNSETGVQRNYSTDERGRYVAPELVPGRYEVAATMTGFETMVRTGFTLTVGQEAAINLSLKVGAVTEQVSVTGEAPLVDTSSSSVSGAGQLTKVVGSARQTQFGLKLIF